MTPLQARALVSTIDLNAICTKVRIQQNWDNDTIARAEREYREYLEAALVNPGRMVPPSRTADEIWHAHILDTQKYAADCKRVFGGMLHHVPNYKPYLDGSMAAEKNANCIANRETKNSAAFCLPKADTVVDAAGCVPCFGQAEQPEAKASAFCMPRAEAPADAAGCVPCLGQREVAAVRAKPATRKVRAKARRTRRTRA